MNGTFDDPMAAAEIQQILGRTGIGGATAYQVQKSFFLMLVTQVIAMTAQQDQLLTEGKAHLFGGDR
jgi:uncharacterized membrane protein YtjA (UPF0391 family)